MSVYDERAETAARPPSGGWDGSIALPTEFADALSQASGVSAIYVKYRPRQASRVSEDELALLAPGSRWSVPIEPEFVAHEEGLAYLIRPGDGLSTGLFPDMRETRCRVRAWAAGRRVLNCFAYTCAFGVAATAGGAQRVLNLDLSRSVLERGQANYRANGFTPDPHDFVFGDVFDWLGRLARRDERFDLVILDPPGFSKTKRGRFSATQDYGSLAALAAGVTAPGGLLLACANVAEWPWRAFRDRVLAGLAAAGRSARGGGRLPRARSSTSRPRPDKSLTSRCCCCAWRDDGQAGRVKTRLSLHRTYLGRQFVARRWPRRAISSTMIDMNWEPSYIALHRSGELAARAQAALASLAHCELCPRACGVDRLAGKRGVCKVGAEPVVASWNVHRWEEPPISGTSGSGTIFFSGCTGQCRFCQNYPISQFGYGNHVTNERLAEMMLELQGRGCHNINFVTPTHFVPQILAAVDLAAGQGLRLPLVYNTSGYETLETLRLLEDVVDLWLPDAKYADDRVARRLSGFPRYVENNRATLQEIYRQVGDELVLDEDGIARRGMIIRHLVLPGGLAGDAAK